MKKLLQTTSFVFLLLILTSCQNNIQRPNDKINVLSSFTIISNMTEVIGGEFVNVHNLVPTGTDPHEYEPLYEDLKATANANLMFYNGLNLEGGDNGWFMRLVNFEKKNLTNVINLSIGIEPLYIHDVVKPTDINPHAFISPLNGIIMAENIKNALIAYDPINASYYETNANNYIALLEAIHEDYLNSLSSIDENNNILVTSERAFQYLAKDYNLREAYIWAIDTEDLGTNEQIKNLVNFLKVNRVNYLFVESNVDTRPMETISQEVNIPIYELVLYADEIGNKNDEVNSYIKFLEHNLKVLKGGLLNGNGQSS